MEPVTSVLLARSQEPDGLRKMAVASVALHVVAIVALVVVPILSSSRQRDDTSQVMTISLGGGAPGPAAGGLNPLAARPVQTVEPAPKPEAVRPPAKTAPELTVPVPKGKPAPKTPAKAEVEEGEGQQPTRGAEVKQGRAFGDTGSEGMGFGLATGGMGGEGSYLDVGNFCCPEYLTTMTSRIRSHWVDRQVYAGEVFVKFTILRDGVITGVEVERQSGILALDNAALRAVMTTSRLAPLPSAFSGDHLTVHLRFVYTR
jgi:TonB family protein